jgi:Txe/YoeB family toxin of Txe-Axe toxin-antitoxin module
MVRNGSRDLEFQKENESSAERSIENFIVETVSRNFFEMVNKHEKKQFDSITLNARL